MPNMFNVLYTRYIDQIKLQEIQNYNEKHHDYLIRSGKHTSNPEQFLPMKNNSKAQSNQNRPIKPQRNQVESVPVENFKKQNNQRKRQYPISNGPKPQTLSNPNQQRPIKSGNNKFNFDEYPPEQNSFHNQRKIQPMTQNSYQTQEMSQYPKNQPAKEPNQERTIKPSQKDQKINQQMTEFNQEDENIILEECPQGCGRKFKPETLEKHIRICQKVFQGKRKPFKVDVVDDQAKKLAEKSEGNEKKSQKPKSSKVPKWKKESEMLRKGLKALEGGSKQSIPSVQEEEQDDRVQCGGCGRKFNEVAAARHIPNCLNRIKQKR